MLFEGVAGDVATLQAEVGELGGVQVVQTLDFAGDPSGRTNIADKPGQQVEGHGSFPFKTDRREAPVILKEI
ncbi:MAG: hypothetical protein Tsb0019_27480 [Roseibium sp.]